MIGKWRNMKISNSFTHKNRLYKKYKIFLETNLNRNLFNGKIDWTNSDLHFNLRLDIWRLWRIKTIYNRKIFHTSPLLASWFRNREIFSDLFLSSSLLRQILLADGEVFFLIQEEVSVSIVCLKSPYFQITMIVV